MAQQIIALLHQHILAGYTVHVGTMDEAYLQDIKTKELFRFTDAVGRVQAEYAAQYPGDPVPSTGEVKQGLNILRVMAARTTKTRIQPHIRVAHVNGFHFIHLAIPESNAMVKISPDGWVVEFEGAYFPRVPGMKLLPFPVKNDPSVTLEQALAVLWPYCHVATEYRILVLLWILECFRADTPKPVLQLEGQEGSGKSVIEWALCMLTDPSSHVLQPAPSNASDVYRLAASTYVLSYENVSGQLTSKVSDALCTLSTGIGHAVFVKGDCITGGNGLVRRPIIINGIVNCIPASDLASRVSTIPVCPPKVRRSIAELEIAFAKDAPLIFGALLDLFVMALRLLPSQALPDGYSTRMVDSALFGMAIAKALHGDPNVYLDAVREEQATSTKLTILGSAVGLAVKAFMDRLSEQSVEAPLQVLFTRVEGFRDPQVAGWPTSPRGFGGVLQKLARPLRGEGIQIERVGKTNVAIIWRFSKILAENSPTE